MRIYHATLFAILCWVAQAHVGSPNVFFEGRAGQYPVRVVIRPADVVPGLAEISVRVQGEGVRRVTVLPVFWNAGRAGAPAPDDAKLVRGETNLYTATLWLMKSGAYSVDVSVEGTKGQGTLIVPVNAVATNTRPMSPGYKLVLGALGILLLVNAIKIIGALFGQSVVRPGDFPSNKDRWRGRGAMAAGSVCLALILFGAKKWWDFEDAEYRNSRLYKPLSVSADLRSETNQYILQLKVDAAKRRGQWTPLIPDHGKIMHLFLIREPDLDAFAHLHPVARGSKKFEVPLPPLPAGNYRIYADVTHEDGFSETLLAKAEIPPPSPAMTRLWSANFGEPFCSTTLSVATNFSVPPDPDDSWHMDKAAAPDRQNKANFPESRRVSELSKGHQMVLQDSRSWMANREVSLRFQLIRPDGQRAAIEPYMGMFGHAAVRRQDGSVFAHVHPVGTFSMAAQEFFQHRGQGSIEPIRQQGNGPVAEPHKQHNTGLRAESVVFPYEFPQAGPYRLWVQMKSAGTVFTGVFDLEVKSAK